MKKSGVVLQFKYSLNLEIRRVLYSLKKLDWYKGNKYYVALPQGLNTHSVRESVKKEYRTEQYKKTVLLINRVWKKSASKAISNLVKDGFKLRGTYSIYLTQYGVGGSYHSPNKIILNYKRRKVKYLSKTIIHEIIHLAIEPLIKKYKIDHWTKERIVDLIVLKNYPKWKETQKITQVSKKVDNLFYKYYPDIELVIKKWKLS